MILPPAARTPLAPALRGPRAAEGEVRVARQLLVEAAKADAFGKPRAALLMRALARTVPRSGAIGRLLAAWPGDLAQDAITFRLSAGLHALARTGRAPGLAALFADEAQEEGAAALPDPLALEAAVLAALTEHAVALGAWIAHPTQTNEVARVAGLVAVLMALDAAGEAMPCEVLELGASAGLNLNFPHYACRIGEQIAGTPGSAVELAPEWRGSLPPVGPVEVVRAQGVDLHPLDPASPADCARLEAYVWPGERARSRRLTAALDLARRHPPAVAQGHAGEWLERALAAPQLAGLRRVVFHSMVMQYADPHERARLDAALAAAGARATRERPLVRVGMEWRGDRAAVELRVTLWDGGPRAGEVRLAALCHPYGEWIEWRGLD
ncbi:DUF2332 domain-containing protein [Erythrobacter sp. NE805]|uniref:DUF2332 domain-containing protein n=1 Tax=Erythrobacter sp. NE805 TaxID=3389875 RepID=UPI00396AF950